MSPRSVCIYVVGSPPEPVARRHGTFVDWFRRLLELDGVEGVPFDGTTGYLPDLGDTAGVVITGSPASLTQPEPWMEAGVELVRECAQRGVPLLGVCFGHQMIGAAYGGEVMTNPRGWEISTHEVVLEEAGRRDPLFKDVPDRFEVNLSHRDIVARHSLSPRNGIRTLATNPRTDIQAVAAGDAVRGIQWHPEFDGAIVRGYIEARYQDLAADAEARAAADDHPDRLLERATDTPVAERIFRNFITEFVLR